MNTRPGLIPSEYQQMRERVNALVRENDALRMVVETQFRRIAEMHSELVSLNQSGMTLARSGSSRASRLGNTARRH